MNISVVGTGYVGLVTGACFADLGNNVICADSNIEKIKSLKKGLITIYEPGLEEMVKRNKKEGRLIFTSSVKEAVSNSLDNINLYPDGYCYNLRAKLSSKLNFVPDDFIFGNGSNDIIELIAKTFLDKEDEIIIAEQSFIVYPTVSKLMDAV